MSLEPIEAIRALILEAIEPLPPRPAPLAEAAGRTAARDYRATSALPPFSNSAMDGYALRSRDTAGAATGAPAVLSVTAEIPAGGAAGPALGRGEAAAIMTGAPLPPGADAVVPVEEVETGTWSRSGRVGILSPVPEGAWVRKAGSALLPGTLIIPKGRLLRPQEIAILAALGIAEIEVYPRPRAALISTGDELTETGRAPEEGKIRDCNRALLRALVEGAGGVAVDCGIAGDRPHALEERLERAAGTDLILTSGGISAGARDEVVPHLRRWGADIRRYRIRMRPGKPFAYGFIRGRPIFCLPGNPVSVYVSFLQFVRPVLLRLQGRPPEEPPEATGTMGADFACAEDRVFFVTARVAETPGGPELFPTGPQSSGDLFSLVSAQGLIRVEPGTATLKRGDRVRFIPLA